MTNKIGSTKFIANILGNTSLAYYAPQVFQTVGAGDSKLLISGFFGIVKVIGCLIFLVFLVERIGRKGALLGGAAVMGTMMLVVAVLTATHPPAPDATHVSPAGAAAITMIYLEAGKSRNQENVRSRRRLTAYSGLQHVLRPCLMVVPE